MTEEPLIEKIARAMYFEFRMGCLMKGMEIPLWHEATDKIREGYLNRAYRLLKDD